MSPTFSPKAQDIVAWFRAAFAALDDHKSQQERVQIYATCVAHIRSAAPMQLLGVSDVLPAATEVVIPLADGARVEVRQMDGAVSLYVLAADASDAAVSMTDAQAEQVRVGLMQVMQGGK